MHTYLRAIALGAAAFIAASGANAQLPGGSQAATTPAGFSPVGQNGAFTMGFSFTASGGSYLNALGAYDYLGDGFLAPMTVGLWDDAGTLLLQTTVNSGDLLLDSFRYAFVPSYELLAGTTYVVGAFRYSGTGEVYATGFGPNANAPGITTIAARVSDNGVFSFPNQSVATNGYFGANALIGNQVVADGGVPEPATWMMMIVGFGALGMAMRRRPTVRVRYA